MILSFILGFISGIAIGSFTPITFGLFLIFLFLLITFFVYKYFVEGENRLIMTFATVVILGVLCGVSRVGISDLYTESHLDKYIGQKVFAEGVVADEPDVRETNTKLTVLLSNVSVATSPVPIKERILVTVPLYPEFHYGDLVKMQVTLQEPQNFESDGRVFDYKGYLRVRGIWYTSRFTSIELISSGHGALIKDLLFKIKHTFTASLDNALPQPQSNLMAGLLLGTKQSLGKDLLAEFQRAGVSHVVVLSGYNIAIVATSIMSILKFLPKNLPERMIPFSRAGLSFGIGAISIILFTLLSGGGASAWRAAIMVLLALFAKNSNREYKVSRVFGLTIVVMLLFNPLLLVFDPSFQLSALATIGLIFVSPLLEPYLVRVTEKYHFREIVSATVATQIVVLPFLIYTTGIVSFTSLPVNILILGTVPLTMLLGFVTGIVGLFSLYLSFIPAFFAYILLWYQLTVVHIGATLPFGVLTLSGFSPLILVLIYLVIVIGLLFIKKTKLRG